MIATSTSFHAQGRETALLVLARMALCQDTAQQTQLLHIALLDLIDVPLGWNNLEATTERLAGFAQALTPMLRQVAGQSGTRPCDMCRAAVGLACSCSREACHVN